MNDEQSALNRTLQLVDDIKDNPDLLNSLTDNYFNPLNGFVSQQYTDWVNSPEYAELRNRGIHLAVNEHTTGTPAEIMQEFERVFSSFMEDVVNGTLEEIQLD